MTLIFSLKESLAAVAASTTIRCYSLDLAKFFGVKDGVQRLSVHVDMFNQRSNTPFKEVLMLDVTLNLVVWLKVNSCHQVGMVFMIWIKFFALN